MQMAHIIELVTTNKTSRHSCAPISVFVHRKYTFRLGGTGTRRRHVPTSVQSST